MRNDLIWNKTDPPPESPRNRWRSGHEHILFLTKLPGNYKFKADAIRVPYAEATIRVGERPGLWGRKKEKRTNAKDSRMRHGKTFTLNPKGCLPTDVWSMPSGDSSALHYATFPERLVEAIICACSDAGDLVLDPFAGSGTTCQIAARLKRRSLGIELNPKYAKMATKAVGASLEFVTEKEAVIPWVPRRLATADWRGSTSAMPKL